MKTDIPQESHVLNQPLVGNRFQRIIPFFKNNDNFPVYLEKVAELSPTRLASIESKTSFCLGDGFELKRGKANNTFAKLHTITPPSTEIETQIETQVLEYAEQETQSGNLLDFLRCVFNDYFTTGNTPVLLMRTSTASVKKFRYKKLETKYIRLVRSEKGDVQEIAVSEKFAEHSYQNNCIDYYPLYPNWSEDDDAGVSYSVHLTRLLLPGRTEYGLPISISSTYWQQIEGGLQKYLDGEVDESFLIKMLLESVESEPSSESEKGSVQDLMEAAWTNKDTELNRKGLKKSRIAFREVEHKDMFSKIHEFNPKIDKDFFDWLLTRSEREILKSERWHKSLLGVHTSQGLGNNKEEMKNAYRLALKNVILPSRKAVMKLINVILKEHFSWELGQELDYYLTLQDGFESMFVEPGSSGAITVNEERRLLGFGEIEDDRGDLLMASITKKNEGTNNSEGN